IPSFVDELVEGAIYEISGKVNLTKFSKTNEIKKTKISIPNLHISALNIYLTGMMSKIKNINEIGYIEIRVKEWIKGIDLDGQFIIDILDINYLPGYQQKTPVKSATSIQSSTTLYNWKDEDNDNSAAAVTTSKPKKNNKRKVNIPEKCMNEFSINNSHIQNLFENQNSTINQTNTNNLVSNNTVYSINNINFIHIKPWVLTISFNKIFKKFQEKILKQYPNVACVYCAKLLYSEKAKWVPYNQEIKYPVEEAFENFHLEFHPNTKVNKVPTCRSCHNPRTRRTPGSNSFTEYRNLVGTMSYSCNIHALSLYTGTIGAFLEPSNNNHVSNELIFDENLKNAADWLAEKNPYIKSFSKQALTLTQNTINETFPTATHVTDDESAPPYLSRDIIIQNYNFPDEVHNEDFHYDKLISGFVQLNNNTKLPISTNHKDLEPLLFPYLFLNGKGHYYDLIKEGNNNHLTFGKYAKHMILLFDPRFRLDHYWPAHTYLQLEKLRNHQNTRRILRQKEVEGNSRPDDINLISYSQYNGAPKINEEITIPLPTFIRTGDSYFHEKELHLNTMLR
ncbi:11067_t:CDS:2, partial [Entrophospora sp. SA101]